MQATLPRQLAAYDSALQTFDRHGAASEGAERLDGRRDIEAAFEQP